MRTHELKTRAEWFDLVATGAKPFELRRDDRGFEVGDELWLRETDSRPDLDGRGYPVPRPAPSEIDSGEYYTGRELRRVVTCVVRGPWLAPGHVALGLRP